MDKTFLEGSDCEKTPEEYLDYVARYDLGFLTPCGKVDIHCDQAQFLDRFLIECRKTKTKVITLANLNRCKQHNEPIRIGSKCM